MHDDQQSYRRAAAAALAGLAVHVLLTAALALTGLWAESPTVHAATLHLAAGLPIWVVLMLVYHQHRLERVEALEAEQLARGDEQSAAIFEEAEQDLNLARRRLQRLHKWGLGGVSVLVAGFLIVVGGVLLFRNAAALVAGTLVEDVLGPRADTGILMAVLVGVAFVAFVVARYVAGMTKIDQWQLLRGGASYLMGGTVLAGLLLVGALFAHFGNRVVLAALAVVLPLLSILIGLEIITTFVLGAYRPRRPGEAFRPAFDSRVLGLLTAPESIAKAISDAIEYQVGVQISRSWFYQLLGDTFTPLFVVGLATLVVLSSLVIVQPHEQAVVTRFGKVVVSEPLGPGPHLKWPWPIGKTEKYAVGRLHQLLLGSVPDKGQGETAILWTKSHVEGEGKEDYLVTAPTKAAAQVADEAAGMELVGAQVLVQYRIKDLMQYIQPTNTSIEAGGRPAEALLGAIAERRLNAYFMSARIDALLGDGRLEAGAALKQQIQADVDDQGLGLNIVFVGVNSVHPPNEGEVAASFHRQIGALLDQQSTIEEARRQATEVKSAVAGSPEAAEALDAALRQQQAAEQALRGAVGDADAERAVAAAKAQVAKLLGTVRGEASRKLYAARAFRWRRAISERAHAERFEAERTAYGHAPDYFRQRRYLDVLVKGLDGARKFIIATDQTAPPVFRVDVKDASNAAGAIFKDSDN